MSVSHLAGILRLLLIDRLRGTSIFATLRLLRKEQYMPKEELKRLQLDKLQKLFQLAQLSTRYYSKFNSYEELPVLSKEDLRANLADFLSYAYKHKRYKKGTGGSTGNPLIYYTTQKAQSYMWAGIFLSWEAAGYTLGDKIGFIAGTSLLKSSLQHKIFYRLLRIKTYSAFNLNDEHIQKYLEQINKDKVKIIYGYATALNIIANYINRTGVVHFPYLKGIVSSAEILTHNMRRNIENAFKVPVFNQYGCNEAGVSAFECEHHKLHLISSRSYYESGENNLLLSTDLANEACIMMKYDTGDIVQFEDEQCPCNRNYPVIKQVIGRNNDTLVDVEHKIVHAAFFQILFRSDETIRQYQVGFDEQSITINLLVDGTLHFDSYHKYLDIVKQHLTFENYYLVLNGQFSMTVNGKHKHIIDNRKMNLHVV